jgi:hypothetical protein
MDTSGSMRLRGNDTLRDNHWDLVHSRFVDLPLRYVAFSSRNQQDVQSDWVVHDKPNLAKLSPNEFGGATYLWGLIVDEANIMIRRGLKPEEVLIYVITDGEDNQSPGLLRGFGGINGCIDELNIMKFPAEFWIVGIGLKEYEAASYQKFASRSGGQFFKLDNGKEEPVASEMKRSWKHRSSDPADWKKQRLRIIRDYLKDNKFESVLNLSGQDSLYALRSIIPVDHEELIEIGTKADAAMESKEWMGPSRHRKGHRWILLRKETYDALDDVKRDALAREISSFKGYGKLHLILDDFDLPLSGVTVGSGSRVLSDLRQWSGTDIDDLIAAIVDCGTSLDSDKIRIGTLERVRIENRFPLPNQPYIVLGPGGQRNSNYSNDDWWKGHYSNDDWNAVPGLPTDTCRPGLVVTPYLDCCRVNKTYHKDGYYEKLRERINSSAACRDFRNCFENSTEWDIPTPMQSLPVPHEERTHSDVWAPSRDCFIQILEEALVHIENCWHSKGMNNQVVIELTQLGKIIGLHNHPALACFEMAVGNISSDIRIRYSYSKVNGLY